ncbi:MAG: thymidine phosphorylase [Oscillospiraceae bacterium]|nr:thymidine phosphorylase [Oscillospiraceae bacterium]
MRIYDIIEKKRDGKKLSFEEISFFVTEYTAERIADYQASALLMAMFINGMDMEETVALTESMAKSGDMLDLSVINGITADKHSTGGVGDKTSLIVAPICASLGIKMAKMSGRGLGHTGGTVDKLESIPGYRVSLSTKEFFEQVDKIGIALIGQTGNLAPADKKLYALRDVTATVDNKSLIASSIMSKKLAAGAKNIVLDVKCGSGAFMKNESDAAGLAELMVKIGKDCGRNTAAIITNMDIPLGTHIGNALEIKEVIDILKNRGDERLRELCITLSAEIIRLSHQIDYNKAYDMAVNALSSGMALNKFKELIEVQGGDAYVIDDPSVLPVSKCKCCVLADKNGYITDMNSQLIGESAVLLGAGREKKDDVIDYGAGIILHKKTADRVENGDMIAELFAENNAQIENAVKLFNKSYKIGDTKPPEKPLIYRTIR